MPTTQRAKPGPKPKPAAIKRSEWIRLRVSPIEEQAAKARAEAAGLKFSDYCRLQLCGVAPAQTAQRHSEAQKTRRTEKAAPGDYEALVQQHLSRMPRRSAEILARRELGRV